MFKKTSKSFSLHYLLCWEESGGFPQLLLTAMLLVCICCEPGMAHQRSFKLLCTSHLPPSSRYNPSLLF